MRYTSDKANLATRSKIHGFTLLLLTQRVPKVLKGTDVPLIFKT